ncbi:LPS export ABC transporter permease LptF [Pelagibius litoralis]|uniref:LPS export ABC transporter permease LptF n=1 Tax=Pelagibius litoralis TaxID=374515 RepID=A0A967EZJ8_9PROT|nr:LPS export ABC transporter permease LptF [Pelagibius litoralis]NIA70292.1 LPS export ABC transporter permease LptF [Pelagibius litoralis]
MPSITRYVLGQLVAATVFVTLALTFAIWLTQSLRLIDYIVNRGLPASTFLTFVGLLLPSFLGVVLPVACFVAALFVYHKLTMDSEMVVMRAAGLSQLQLARPAILLGVIVTLAVYSISLYFLPASFRNFKDLQHAFRSDFSAILLQEGVFTTVTDEITVYVRERSPEGELRGILVHDNRDPKKAVTMMAERGALVPSESGPRVVMENGNRQEVQPGTGRFSLLYFDRYTVELADFGNAPQARWREPKERFLHELLSPSDDRRDQRYRLELLAEGHQRIVAPLYSLVFVVIGMAALLAGEFNRRGQLKRVLAAIACVAALEGVSLALHDLASRNTAAVPAMYAAVFLSIGLGFFVLLRKPSRSGQQPAAEAEVT